MFSLFNNVELDIIGQLVKIVEILLKKEERLERELAHEKRKRRVVLALTTQINNQKYITMNTSLTLGVNAQSQYVLIDIVTLQPVTSAVFSGQTVASSDDTIATFQIDPLNPNQIIATPIAVGIGSINISSLVSYTDSLGNPVTATLTSSFPFSVAVGADGVLLSLTDFVPLGSTTTTSTTTIIGG